jgi:hypothetical protein
LKINGRGEWIRTTDLTVPNRALYQAEPRPDIDLDSSTAEGSKQKGKDKSEEKVAKQKGSRQKAAVGHQKSGI